MKTKALLLLTVFVALLGAIWANSAHACAADNNKEMAPQAQVNGQAPRTVAQAQPIQRGTQFVTNNGGGGLGNQPVVRGRGAPAPSNLNDNFSRGVGGRQLSYEEWTPF